MPSDVAFIRNRSQGLSQDVVQVIKARLHNDNVSQDSIQNFISVQYSNRLTDLGQLSRDGAIHVETCVGSSRQSSVSHSVPCRPR